MGSDIQKLDFLICWEKKHLCRSRISEIWSFNPKHFQVLFKVLPPSSTTNKQTNKRRIFTCRAGKCFFLKNQLSFVRFQFSLTTTGVVWSSGRLFLTMLRSENAAGTESERPQTVCSHQILSNILRYKINQLCIKMCRCHSPANSCKGQRGLSYV